MRYADGIVYVKRGDNYVPMRAENLLYAATGSNSVELGFWNAESGEVDTYIEPDQNQVTVAEQTAREMKKIFPGRLLESRYGNGIRVLWPLDKLDWDRIFPLERKPACSTMIWIIMPTLIYTSRV